MQSSYSKFAILMSINAIAMFFIMYVMINTFDHFYFNINKAYMALMMVAPMAMLMLFMMQSMYSNKVLNIVLYGVLVLFLFVSFLFVRTQAFVGNEQFLRSMIPHHSGAILMCQQAAISDPEIERLCGKIVEAQKEEIAQMKNMLARY